MKSNNARPEEYCCDSQPETAPCQSAQINPSSPGLHWHPQARGAQGRMAFPWISSAMEKSRRREKTRSRGWEYPREAIVFLLRKLQVLWMCSGWFTLVLNLPMQRQNDEQTSKLPKSCPSRGILLHGKNGWTQRWEEASLVQRHSVVTGNKETETWFCEGHFSFVRGQGQGATGLLNWHLEMMKLAGKQVVQAL